MAHITKAQKGNRSMKQNAQKLSTKEKVRIIAATGVFAVIGAVLGVIAYYQHWLG